MIKPFLKNDELITPIKLNSSKWRTVGLKRVSVPITRFVNSSKDDVHNPTSDLSQ